MWDSAGVLRQQVAHKKGTSEVIGNSTRRVKVEGGGTGVLAHVGLHAVRAFADRFGLGDA